MLPLVHTIVQFSVLTAIQIVCIMSGQTCFQKTCQHGLGSLHVLKALPPFAAFRIHVCNSPRISNGMLFFFFYA